MAAGSLLATLLAGLWHCSLRDASNFRMDGQRIFRPYRCYTDRNDINETRKSSKSRSPQRQAQLVALNSWLRKKWSMNPLERDGGRETKENARQRMPVGRNSHLHLCAPFARHCSFFAIIDHRHQPPTIQPARIHSAIAIARLLHQASGAGRARLWSAPRTPSDGLSPLTTIPSSARIVDHIDTTPHHVVRSGHAAAAPGHRLLLGFSPQIPLLIPFRSSILAPAFTNSTTPTRLHPLSLTPAPVLHSEARQRLSRSARIRLRFARLSVRLPCTSTQTKSTITAPACRTPPSRPRCSHGHLYRDHPQ